MGTQRTTFFLHVASDAEAETWVLADVNPMRGNQPELMVESHDDTVGATVLVQTSSDRSSWSTLTSVAVSKLGRDKVAFTTNAKYVRFRLAADAPGGIECTLVNWDYDPVHTAGV